MHHRISSMLGKISDYKICLHCGRINWYENESCIDCGHDKFRPAKEQDVLSLIKAWKESGHYCDDCEIDV